MLEKNYDAYKYIEQRIDVMKYICEPLEKYFNVGFYYTKIFPGGRYLRLGSNLEWERYYLQNFHTFELPEFDFLPLKPLDDRQQIIPFLWPQKPMTKLDQLVYQFGFWEGLSFSRINPDSYETWTLYSLNRSSMTREFFASQHVLMEKFISFFNNQIESIASPGPNYSPVLARFKDGFPMPKSFIHCEKQFSATEFMNELNNTPPIVKSAHKKYVKTDSFFLSSI
jgi:hypothetical protein